MLLPHNPTHTEIADALREAAHRLENGIGTEWSVLADVDEIQTVLRDTLRNRSLRAQRTQA